MQFIQELHHRLGELRRRGEHGQTLVEYGLIIALVSVALIGSLTALNVGITGLFTNVISHF